jgi:hypothetical protein
MGFALDLRAFTEKAKLASDTVVRKVVLDIGKELVERSPVGDATLWSSPPPPGYVGGRFRANWQYQFDAPATGTLPDIDPSGGASNRRILAGVSAAPAIGVHYLVNNLPYARRLEDGHSSQAPKGMVGLTVIGWRQYVDKAARA